MNSAIENHRSTVEKINEAFIQLSSLSNDELRHQLKLIEDRVNSSKSTDEVLSDRLVMVYAIAKETARRFSNGNVIVKANDYDRYLADNYDFVSIVYLAVIGFIIRNVFRIGNQIIDAYAVEICKFFYHVDRGYRFAAFPF